MSCNISLDTKTKSISIGLSMISILSILYFTIQPKLIDEYHQYNLNDVLHIITPSLSLVSNLLLYQAVLDIHHQSLYYWPKPKVCILSWLLIHAVVALLILYEITSCLFPIRDENVLPIRNSACFNLDTSVKSILKSLSVILMVEELLILLGMMTVISLLADYKKQSY